MMGCKVLVVFLAFVVAMAIAAPVRPRISEVFSAGSTVTISTDNNVTVHGHGFLVSDTPANRRYEMYAINEASHKHYGVRLLDRYDLHKSYEVVNNKCNIRDESGELPSMWGWLNNASYDGSKIVEGVQVDIWTFKAGHGGVAIGVNAKDVNKPVFYWLYSPSRNTTIRFTSWSLNKPEERFFDVPKECHTETAEVAVAAPGCQSRNEMLARGSVWVARNIPYSQTHYYEGWREDCSGFVSMCWNIGAPGYTTSTMHEIAHPINKDQLSPGDVMLCAGDHVVLFVGWNNAAKTDYTYYAETQPGEGCVKRTSTYPYYYNQSCFKPYRYNAVC